jgi:hypothetical protein
MVGVADDDAARTVEPDPDDRWSGRPVAVQDCAGKPPVIRLDPAYGGKQRPADPTRRDGVGGRAMVSVQ